MDKDISEICINRQKKINFSHKHLLEKSSWEEKKLPEKSISSLVQGSFWSFLGFWNFNKIMTTDDCVKQKRNKTAAAVQAQMCPEIQVSPGLSGIYLGKVRSWEGYSNYFVNSLILRDLIVRFSFHSS